MAARLERDRVDRYGRSLYVRRLVCAAQRITATVSLWDSLPSRCVWNRRDLERLAKNLVATSHAVQLCGKRCALLRFRTLQIPDDAPARAVFIGRTDFRDRARSPEKICDDPLLRRAGSCARHRRQLEIDS